MQRDSHGHGVHIWNVFGPAATPARKHCPRECGTVRMTAFGYPSRLNLENGLDLADDLLFRQIAGELVHLGTT